MKQGGVWVLALIAVALIAAAVYVTNADRTARPVGVGELLYPALASSLDDVTGIRIHGPGDATVVTVQRAKTGWQVAERSGYPADQAQVRTLLLALADARTVEQKTSITANYPALGVEDLKSPGATGARIELDGARQPVALIVGKSTGSHSTFVRRSMEPASWQIGVALHVERDPAKWLSTDLIDIGADRIQSAEISTTGQQAWSAAKAARSDLHFKLTGKPPGGADTAQSTGDRVATALAGLHLVDVRPAAETTAKPAATATFRTFDGLVVGIDGYTDGDKRYVRLRTSADEAAVRRYFVASAPSSSAASTAAPAKTASPATAAATATTPEAVLEKTRAEASKLDARLASWAFEIPGWSYDAIFPKPEAGANPAKSGP